AWAQATRPAGPRLSPTSCNRVSFLSWRALRGYDFGATRAPMRPPFPALLIAMLLAGCAPSPIAASAPTPVSLKPANLRTPRPTIAPTETPVQALVGTTQDSNTLEVAVVPTPRPLAIPTPVLEGTPVATSEALQGLLLDDRLVSPIIGESFPYRVYLPPDYLNTSQRRY